MGIEYSIVGSWDGWGVHRIVGSGAGVGDRVGRFVDVLKGSKGGLFEYMGCNL